MKEILAWLVAIVVLFVGIFLLNYSNLKSTEFFAPRYEAVHRNTFEQSKSYQQGVIQELQNMQFEYIKADKDHKIALASIIKHRAADIDVNILPVDLYNFIKGL